MSAPVRSGRIGSPKLDGVKWGRNAAHLAAAVHQRRSGGCSRRRGWSAPRSRSDEAADDPRAGYAPGIPTQPVDPSDRAAGLSPAALVRGAR